MTDSDLLKQYLHDRSPAALAEIVRQNADLVYATALRETRDPHVAEDVMQAVFLVFVRRAATLSRSVVLAGWFYQATIFAAADARKLAARRQFHEREAAQMNPAPASDRQSPAENEELVSQINQAVVTLHAADRDVISLRFLRGMSTLEVAAALGTSELVARKRLSRALERLRKHIARRGALLAAAVVAGALESLKAQAAPASAVAHLQSVILGNCPASNLSISLAQGIINMYRRIHVQRVALTTAATLAVISLAGVLGFAVGAPAAAPIAAAASRPAVSSPAVPDSALAPALSAANARFAFDFFHQVNPNVTTNAFASPYSVSAALAMTWAGARGNTAAEMARTLRLSDLNEGQVTPAFRSLNAALAQAQKRTGAQLAVANSLWLEKTFPVHPAFLDQVHSDFAAELTPVDFLQAAENARLQINTWVAGKTNDKIQDILQSGNVDNTTRLVLVNAIYFKGTWSSPFESRQNVDANFQTAGGPKPVVLMHQLLAGPQVRYGDFPDAAVPFQMLSLPYFARDNAAGLRAASGDLSMVVVLPQNTHGLEALEKVFSVDMLNTSFDKMAFPTVEVFLPKFKIEQRYDLGADLQKMGVKDAFLPAAADFSGIADRAYRLSIQKVIHKTFVEVNEVGTEAAAATVVSMMAGGRGNPVRPTFRADHPFLFFIRENTTGSILFMGRLAAPSAAK